MCARDEREKMLKCATHGFTPVVRGSVNREGEQAQLRECGKAGREDASQFNEAFNNSVAVYIRTLGYSSDASKCNTSPSQ
ncbi:multidrug resistance protein 1B [Aspergillus udagawae]|uniref:Multidrug resistance protein 1B n=1 Tax=Aspergillus udagawae TaxID=91492 RepID=A0A8H3NRF0_9EURO|nr:multidrug resistance protein 1B [Aspergillus udagawae]